MSKDSLVECSGKAESSHILMLCALILVLASCASSGSEKVDSLTIDDAQRVIVIGKTTKADVKQAFGEADIIPFASGEEMWIYQAKRGSILKSIPVANRFAKDDDDFKELKIAFGKDNVAKKFQLLDTRQSRQ